MRSPVKVALLGYGTVGRSVARILDECTDEAKLTRILMRPGFNPKDQRMTDSFESILDDHSIEVVAECMGGLEPAHEYIVRALMSGKHVVTSNKAVVSTYFSEFVSVGEKYGSTLRIEACVGGGIPWIAGIEKAKRIDAITGFSGILNGTTNYIVYSMLKDGTDFAEVLGKAQELGYAERDPSADIDGLDVRAKTMISATVAFDVQCTDLVPTSGIRNLTRRDLAFFGNHGRTVKLFGHGVCKDGRYAVAVEPVAIPMETLEAHVPLNFNIATLTGKTIGELTFYGQGAGGDPTANAVVQDILDIAHKNFPTYSFVYKDSQALIYEPKLLRSSYVIRTEAPVCDGKVYEPGAYIVRDITALQARELLDEALKSDPTSFMAALGERK
ncbi:homoserine dehydrogenase [Lancefieldella rimae]|uniref:homoserine dehydrogenase n=1 Tax=Lancefieldella rimae TaxID=1383 RepID=UPI00288BB190|nr:homoserine dehydrogenase [Lancefieldella rimae]